MMRTIGILTLAGLAMAPLAISAQATDSRMGGNNIKACSKYHAGKCTSGVVKSTPIGQKVRLKGGTEVWCQGDCRDTLRRSTVDFWTDFKLSN